MANSHKITRFEPQWRDLSADRFADARELAGMREPLCGEWPLGRYPEEGC